MKSVPLSLHPDVISRHFARDEFTGELLHDDALVGLTNAAKFGHEVASRVEEAFRRIMGNKLSTDLANEKSARETIFKMQQSVLEKIDAANNVGAAARDTLIATFANPPKAKNFDEVMIASDTRKALALMPSFARRKAVDAAISAGDDMLVSAVLHSPSISSGFTQEETDVFRSNWQRVRFPKEVARAARLERAMDDLSRGGSSFIAYCNSFTSASKVQKAIESEAQAISATKMYSN